MDNKHTDFVVSAYFGARGRNKDLVQENFHTILGFRYWYSILPREQDRSLYTRDAAYDKCIEELQAKADGFDELRAKVNELERELHIIKSTTVIENPTDENQTIREPANHGRYELKIMNDIKERVYTGSEVRGQDGELLKVAICYNGQKITSGSLASARFEVVVLEGNLSIAKVWPEVGSVLALLVCIHFKQWWQG